MDTLLSHVPEGPRPIQISSLGVGLAAPLFAFTGFVVFLVSRMDA